MNELDRFIIYVLVYSLIISITANAILLIKLSA